MVVVGPTHRGPIGRVLPGSTGRRLIAESGVPVAVAPRGYGDVDDGREIERVGVALDGSEESAAALAAAEAFAYLIEADLDRIEIDGPARDLLEVPGDAVDLMVIGSEARGALASWLMGSPSTEVASLAPWPMVVVTPAMDAGRAAGA